MNARFVALTQRSHPHVVAEPREDNFGIALFSRIPLTNYCIIELDEAGVPSIRRTCGWALPRSPCWQLTLCRPAHQNTLG